MNDDQSQASSGASDGPILEAPVMPSGDNGDFTAEDKAEVSEWENAAEDVFPDVKKVEEGGNKDEQTKSKEGSQEDGKSNKTPQDQKSNEKQGNGNDDESTTQTPEAEPTAPADAISRLSAREQQQQVNVTRDQVREQMFVEKNDLGQSVLRAEDGTAYHLDNTGKPMLADKDGDPIRGVEDVMRHMNPNTGEPFTEEEASLWLINSQQKLRDDVANINERVSELADTNLIIKDEADIVNYEFGELLKAMPDVRQELWDQYSKTFQTDPKTGIITKAPVSLESFYRTALAPYVKLGAQLETQSATQAQTEAQQRQVAEQAKLQRRADRSDIYGGGKTDLASDEDNEWNAAATAVFGPIK